MKTWEEKLKIYDELVAKCPGIKRKGKTVPSTTVNGNMFSMLNKDGEIGIRFSKEQQQKYIIEWNSDIYKAYNSVMHGYVKVPEDMLNDLDLLAKYLMESHEYAKTIVKK